MAESNKGQKTLFHVSDELNIRRFEPRPSAYTDEPVVWAVDDDRLRNYLLPRDCPRVTFYAGPNTSVADVQRFLGSSRSVVALETGWLDRVQSSKLFCYHLPADGFSCIDDCAGYFVNREAVTPQRVEVFENLLEILKARNVEVRTMPSLWQLHDAVAQSTLQFSMIRMRNAARPKHRE
jgi:hypothetical protein